MTNGCYVVPGGWTLVGFVGDQTTSCFANSSSSTVFEGPSGGTCTCGCTMTSQPACASGPIGVNYDNHMSGQTGTCGLAGQPSTMNNMGSCATDMYVPQFLGPNYPQIDLEYLPPAPSGGGCGTSATPDQGSVTYSGSDTFCTPNTSPCTAGMPCTPNLPSPFSVCIEQSGDVACPGATFTQKHLVGGAATFGCGSGCTCSVPSSAPCTGTMKLYTDNNCTMSEYDIAASSAGMCVAPGAGEKNVYNSYHYVADQAATVTCSSAGSSSPTNLALTSPTTICCAP